MAGAAGLVGVMPLTGALVLVWVAIDSGSDPRIMQQFTWGASGACCPLCSSSWSPSAASARLPLPVVLAASFGAWLAAALVHQWALR